MSYIIDATLAARDLKIHAETNGTTPAPVRLNERRHQTPAATNTIGHSATHGGLRGHSIDQGTYPWRVVATGDDAWLVVDVTGRTVARHTGPDACTTAHADARIAKAVAPGGRIHANSARH